VSGGEGVSGGEVVAEVAGSLVEENQRECKKFEGEEKKKKKISENKIVGEISLLENKPMKSLVKRNYSGEMHSYNKMHSCISPE